MDGYFFSKIPELMVDPDYRRRGIGRELMHRALAVAPHGRLCSGAQLDDENFSSGPAFGEAERSNSDLTGEELAGQALWVRGAP